VAAGRRGTAAPGEAPELLGAAGALLGLPLGDQTSPHEVHERRVHGLHPELAAGLHGGVDLVVLTLPYEVAHARSGNQGLARNDAPFAVAPRDKRLDTVWKNKNTRS
jgi:hypothetical protein